MHTVEIPREEWMAFLNRFSRDHQGEPVTVELLGSDIGDQLAARDVPLLGISADPKSSEGTAIEVMVGDSPSTNLIRVIHTPAHVLLAQDEKGVDQALQIEASDGPTTLVRLGPVRAEDFVGY